MTEEAATKPDLKVLQDELWRNGTARGRRLACFVSEVASGLEGKSVLDLGCATGGITRVLASEARFACGLDNRWANVGTAAALTAQSGPSFLQGNALQLPFCEFAFDVVLMSGVLEWLGFALPDQPPRVAQLAGLREIWRVTAPGGHVIVGIENRWFPKFLWRSPHQRLPLALLMPARLLWAVARRIYGQQLHERIYGPRSLARLMGEAGFGNTDLYIPLFSYQFPREVVHADERRALLAALPLARPNLRMALQTSSVALCKSL